MKSIRSANSFRPVANPIASGTEEWDAITRRGTEDRLVDLSLGRFRRRPPVSALPIGLQRDIRAV